MRAAHPRHEPRSTRFAARLALAALAWLAAFAPPVRAEYPLNSSFEFVAHGFAAHWTRTGGHEAVSLDTVAADARTGSNCLKLSVTEGGGEADGVRSEPVRIRPGRKYIASVKCRLTSGTVAALTMEFRNAAGESLGRTFSASCQPVTGEWQAITVLPQEPATHAVLAAPAGATQVTLWLHGSGRGPVTCYFDNAIVTEVADVPVPNGSFEDAESGGFPREWKGSGAAAEGAGPSAAFEGSRGLQIRGTSKAVSATSAAIPVIPGRRYLATIKCRAPQGRRAELALEYWNPGGMKMMSFRDAVVGTGDWQDLTVTPEEPASKEQIVAPYAAHHLTITVSGAPTANETIDFDAAEVLVDEIDFARGGVRVANPGFERVDASGFPLDWTSLRPDDKAIGTADRSFGGQRSLRIRHERPGASSGVESRKFPVLEGKSYAVSLRYLVENSSPDPQFRVSIRYFAHESDLTPRSYSPDERLSSESEPLTARGSWQQLTRAFKPPFLAKYASLVLSSEPAGRGDAYFDDVSVAAVAAQVSNGSFEEWGLSGYPQSWSAFGDGPGVFTRAATEQFSDIARSLKVEDTSATEAGGARSNRITAVTAGKAYTASAQFRVEKGTLSLYLEFWNQEGVRVGETHTPVRATEGWVPITVTGVAPGGTAYATVLIYSSKAGVCTGYADAVAFEPDVVDVASHRQLFIDDHVIKSLTGVRKTINPGTIANGGQPILVKDQPWETNYLICYGSLVYEPLEAKYRLYYTTGARTCYAISDDGVTGWTKPDLGVFSLDGSTHNNIVVDESARPPEGSVGLSVVLDPAAKDPTKRYRAFAKWHFITGKPEGRPAWYKMVSSRDGKTFGDAVDTVNGWDVATMAYDSSAGQLVAAAKYYDNARRVARMTTSSDGKTWSVPVRSESLADAVDAQGHLDADCYGLGWYPYDGVYIGFDWVFQIDSRLDGRPGSQVGLVTPELVFSRDLTEAWYRPTREPLIPRGAKGTWNQGVCYTASYAVPQGDKVLVYFSAADAAHSSGGISKIGLATWRLDGFASLNSEGAEGVVLTKQLTFAGSALELNVDAHGAGSRAEVELLDAQGNLIPGFAKRDCDAIVSDATHATVTWNGRSDVAALAGRTVQLKIYLNDAKLYALQFR